MAISKVFQASRCTGCRSALIRAFTSTASAGLPPRASRLRTSFSACPFAVRLYSQAAREDEHQDTKDYETTEGEEGVQNKNVYFWEENGKDQENRSKPAPWYLQVESPPARTPAALLERQRIPELPALSPPILDPLVQYVSIDLGLDSLSVLDLRELDPPPALGANLLMVVGTARSEKHLHVSADRLCRWLWATYKLRSDADGLLGRNELKLKLRRKARRSKLLGSSSYDNGDDGIKTGWVCVNVGTVDGHEGEMEDIQQPEGYVGFGRRSNGIKLVVQMLTEEKREEIDLERLWEGILRRSRTIDSAVRPEQNVADEQLTVDSAKGNDTHYPSFTTSSSVGSIRRSSEGPSSILPQTRGFHSLARRMVL